MCFILYELKYIALISPSSRFEPGIFHPPTAFHLFHGNKLSIYCHDVVLHVHYFVYLISFLALSELITVLYY